MFDWERVAEKASGSTCEDYIFETCPFIIH